MSALAATAERRDWRHRCLELAQYPRELFQLFYCIYNTHATVGLFSSRPNHPPTTGFLIHKRVGSTALLHWRPSKSAVLDTAPFFLWLSFLFPLFFFTDAAFLLSVTEIELLSNERLQYYSLFLACDSCAISTQWIVVLISDVVHTILAIVR